MSTAHHGKGFLSEFPEERPPLPPNPLSSNLVVPVQIQAQPARSIVVHIPVLGPGETDPALASMLRRLAAALENGEEIG